MFRAFVRQESLTMRRIVNKYLTVHRENSWGESPWFDYYNFEIMIYQCDEIKKICS